MGQTRTAPFQEALDMVEGLPPEDREVLIDLIQRRLVEQRRMEIARNAEETLQAVRQGCARRGSLEELKRDLLPEP